MKSDITRGEFSIIGTKPSNDLIISLEEIRTWLNITNPSEESDFDFKLTTLRDTAIAIIENEILYSYIIRTDVLCKLCFFSNNTNGYNSYIYTHINNVFYIDMGYIKSIDQINYIIDGIDTIYDSTKYKVDLSNNDFARIYCADSDNNYYFPNPDTNDCLGVFGNVSVNFNCGLFSSDLSDKTPVLNKIKQVIMEYIQYKYSPCGYVSDSTIFKSLNDLKTFRYNFLQ